MGYNVVAGGSWGPGGGDKQVYKIIGIPLLSTVLNASEIQKRPL